MGGPTDNAIFNQAAEDVKSFKSADNNEAKLKLYGLYKQATIGDNTADRPGMFDMTRKYKWDAWTERKGMSMEDAQQQYIDFVNELRAKESS